VFYTLIIRKGAISSVGLEHYLDRVGVTGSNPVLPTRVTKPGMKCRAFLRNLAKLA
jgi:hypothetical protein